MMNFFSNKLFLGMAFLVAVAIMAAGNYFSHDQTDQLAESGQLVTHSSAIIHDSEALISLVKDVETGVRGYLLTDKEEFLDSFYQGDAALALQQSALFRLTAHSEVQQKQLKIIAAIVQDKLDIAKYQIRLRKKGMNRDSIAERYQGAAKRVMDELRDEIKNFQQQEHKLLQQRTATFLREREQTQQLLIYNNWFALTFVTLCFGALMIKLRQEEQQKELLEVRVGERTKELAAANEELNALNEELLAGNEEISTSNEEVNAANEQLIQYVAQLNAQGEELKRLLHEKEVLLKEVYHRVKNNIGVISGLLEVQVHQTESDEAKVLLESTIKRTKVIMLAQEKLYRSDNLAYIDLQTYLSQLIDNICDGYSISTDPVQVTKEIEAIYLEVDIINTFGLIINELVSNCLKYAFAGVQDKRLYVFFGKMGDAYILQVEDTGIGLPENFDNMEKKSLGWELVNMLSSAMEGTVSWKNGADSGLHIQIRFSDFHKHIRHQKKQKVALLMEA